MSHLSKALERAGYLQPLAAGIKRLMQKNKDEEDQQQYNQLMQSAMDSLRKSYSTQPEDNIQWNSETPSQIAPPQTELGKQVVPKSPNMDMSDDPGNITGVNVKPKAPGINIEEPDFQILGDVGGRKYGDSADQQRMNQDKVYADFYNKAMNIKGLDPAKLQQGLQALKLQGAAYTPGEPKPKEFKQFDMTKDTYEINPETGDMTLYKAGTEKQSIKTLGSFAGADGYEHLWVVGNDGVIKELKSESKVRPLKGTTINIPPPKSEKWKDYGAYINSIYYKEDPITHEAVPRTPEEQKIARAVAINQAKGVMLPRAVNWVETEIKGKWGTENISQADFETEIAESYNAGELTKEEAQDLLDFDQYRPQLYDVLRESARVKEGEQ
jgi:hypothetical protein